MEREGLLESSSYRQSYDSMERCHSGDDEVPATVSASASSSRVRTLLMIVMALFAAIGVFSFTTTPEQRASAVPKMLELMQMRGVKQSLTMPGELANTPPPSPSVITFTYAPTYAPTQEKSDTLPSKKKSTLAKKMGARGDTIFMHADESGNTPPPSPSVLKYTYAPSNAPTEENEEKDEKEGTDVSFDTVDTSDSKTTDYSDSKNHSKKSKASQ